MSGYFCGSFQLEEFNNKRFFNTLNYSISITHEKFWLVLQALKPHQSSRITDEKLSEICAEIDVSESFVLKHLGQELSLLKPVIEGSLQKLTLDIDDPIIHDLLLENLSAVVELTPHEQARAAYGDEQQVILCLRQTYDDTYFEQALKSLAYRQYIITAGFVQKTLQIDNLYSHYSGLPSHFSNLSQIQKATYSGLSLVKDNWMLYYRQTCMLDAPRMPRVSLNSVEKGFVAYSLYQHVKRLFSPLEQERMVYDELKMFTAINIDSGEKISEVATHSPDDIAINIQRQECVEHE